MSSTLRGIILARIKFCKYHDLTSGKIISKLGIWEIRENRLPRKLKIFESQILILAKFIEIVNNRKNKLNIFEFQLQFFFWRNIIPVKYLNWVDLPR